MFFLAHVAHVHTHSGNTSKEVSKTKQEKKPDKKQTRKKRGVAVDKCLSLPDISNSDSDAYFDHNSV